MKRFLFKIYSNSYVQVVCFVLCLFWIIGAETVLKENFFIEEGVLYTIVVMLPLFLFVIVFLFAKYYFSDFLKEERNKQIIKLKEEIEKSDIKDIPLIDTVNKYLLFVADNLTYQIKDNKFLLYITNPVNGEEEVLKDIELTDDKKSLIADNGLINFVGGYKVRVYHDDKENIQVSLDVATLRFYLFNLSSFDTKFYKRNEESFKENSDAMLLRVNHIFVDFLGAKEYPEVRYFPSNVASSEHL